MPIEAFITRAVNPFTKAVHERLDAAALCPVGTSHAGLQLRARKAKRSEIAAAGSRFGGPPVLPPKVKWPEGPDGPLTFVGQLDFAQLRAVHHGALPLPASGVLALFYDVERLPLGRDRADRRGFRLIYVTAASRAMPRDSEALDPLPLRILDASLQLPAVAARRPDHRVCGSAAWIQDDPRVSIALLAHGLDASPKSLRAAERRGEDVVGIARDAARWQLLWQIDAERELFSWGDGGRFYLLIRDDDLAACRFEAAWFVVQSG